MHYGKPKFWYVIGREDGVKLEEICKKYLPDSFNKCPEYLRHKTTMINPYILKKLCPDIRIEKVCQNAGEFIITFPHCYHSGFNWGFNLAEAVNFAVPGWLNKLPYSGICQCQSDNVRINPTEFYKNLIIRNPNLKYSNYTKILRQYIKNQGENLDEIHACEDNDEILDENFERKPCISGGRKLMSSAKKAQLREGVCDEDTDLYWQKIKESKKENKYSYKVQKPKIHKRYQMAKALGKNRRSASLNKYGRIPPMSKLKKSSRLTRLSKKISKEKTSKKLKKDEEIVHWVQCESCYKWRKIPSGQSKAHFKKKFYCEFLEGNTCETSEESWRSRYTVIARD